MDGKVVIETTVDQTGAKVGVQRLEASLRKMAESVKGIGETAELAIRKQIDSFSRLGSQYEKQSQKVDNLKQKLTQLSEIKVETDEYKKLISEMETLENKSKELISKLEVLAKGGLSYKNSSSFRADWEELNQLREKLKPIWEKKEEMERTGANYALPKNLQEEYKDTADRLAAEQEKLDQMNSRLGTSYDAIKLKIDEYREALNGLDNSVRKNAQSTGILSAALNSLKKTFSFILKKAEALASALGGTVVRGLKKVSAGIFGIHKSANKTTLSLKNLLKYGLGIRSLFVLFNKLRSAIVDGFKNLAQYSGTTNNSISALTTALTQLKNSFATAFNPILSVVSPILVTFINQISKALTYVGMFIAALSGQSTFTKAVAAQEDYAASLDKTSQNAKKAKKSLTGYLSGLDEIQRYDDKKTDDTGSTKYKGPSPSEMFEETPINSTIKDLADKIKKLVEEQDWEGLGKYIADGINTGLQYVYSAISWDNVGPKITAFTTAFTTAFNSLVANIDWPLLGRTLGAGLNTAVYTLNQLIGTGGIDFAQIGRGLAKALRGMIGEIDWKALGTLLGNKFMIPWRMLSGFVKEMGQKDGAGITGWRALGNGIGKAMTAMFQTISMSDIADAIVGVVNGAFDILAGFNEEFDWDGFKENLKTEFEKLINEIKWEDNGKVFGDFLNNLCDCIEAGLDDNTFYDLGEGIGTFIAQLPWLRLLKDVGRAIIDGIGGALSGLWNGEDGLSGKILAGLIVAFGAVKINSITGIGTLAGELISDLASKFIKEKNTRALATAVESAVSTGLSGATEAVGDLGEAAATAAGSEGIGALATSLGSFIGTAGILALIAAGMGEGTRKLAAWGDELQGGDGKVSHYGTTMQELAKNLQDAGTISGDTRQDLFFLNEQLEDTSTPEEYGKKLGDALYNAGVNASELEGAFGTLQTQTSLTDDEIDAITAAIGHLKDKTTEAKDVTKLSADQYQGMHDKLQELGIELGLTTDQLNGIDTALNTQKASGATAEKAYKAVKTAIENVGTSTENVDKILDTLFPQSLMTASDSAKEHSKDISESADGAIKKVNDSVDTASKGIDTAAKKTEEAAETIGTSAENIKKDTDDAFADVETTSSEKWGGAYKSVSDNVGSMSSDTKREMDSVKSTVQRSWGDISRNTGTYWDRIAKKVTDHLEDMAEAAGTAADRIARELNGVVDRINGTVGNINRALAGVENAFTFTYNYENPVTKQSQRYRSWLNLPRINTIPYLATGAVIPPRSEFLAVLGDQKQGNNIEAPEGLLRKIIREESGGNQGGGNMHFTAQINRRTLFDEMISEAKLRQMNSGSNPFDL